ncbi:MAG: rRNA maturation RNase YbeY [Methylotenera sp.]|nr:rRNA maturation RNase YbeY [Oligoflexia bacterium]
MNAKKVSRTVEWSRRGEKQLKLILQEVQKSAALLRLGGLKSGSAPPGKNRSLQVELSLLGNAKMAELNETYRGKPVPTDVLSFPSPPIFRQQGLLGELLICLPVLRRQAKDRKHPEATELQVLLVHGVLHLLELDHERGDAEAAEMAKWETHLLKKLGVKIGPRTVSGLIERTADPSAGNEEPRGQGPLKRGATQLRKNPSKRWTVESP